MHYVKPTLLFSAFLVLCPSFSWAQSQLAACLEQGKKEFAGRDYIHARSTFERCLKMDSQNVDTLLSLGGVALTQDKLDEARRYFLRAIGNMERTSPYFSYTYSMLGDIAFKQQQPQNALRYYERSLGYNRANVNSLVGKAVITENQGDVKTAAKLYETALAVEPLNVVARKRLTALEPLYFSDEEMLSALKQRYAALPDKKELSAADRELFAKMHSAEQRGGIEYLKSKYSVLPADYTVTLFKDTDFAREVLTVGGYNALQKQVGQDAVSVFQKMNVRTQDVFDLRDLQGNKIFLPDSTLTDSGFAVYNEALQGRKAFLLPKEDVPPTQDDLNKIAERISDLKKNGYTEISRAELALVQKQTNCSEDTLRQYMGLYVLVVSKSEKRYFIPQGETTDPKKGAAYYYVARARAQRDPKVVIPRNTLAQSYDSYGYKICSSVDGQLLEM